MLIMNRIIFLTSIFLCFLTSCNKSRIENYSDTFIVTFDGASFPCTGLKSFVDTNDINRLNLVLGNESTYNSTIVGLMDLKGSYKKNDKIQVRVTKFKLEEDQHCPAFSPFQSVLVLSEQLVD